MAFKSCASGSGRRGRRTALRRDRYDRASWLLLNPLCPAVYSTKTVAQSDQHLIGGRFEGLIHRLGFLCRDRNFLVLLS